MSLITDIEEIITTLYPDSLFVTANHFNANYESYLATLDQLPIIVFDNELPKNSTIQNNNNVIKDTKVIITILDLDDLDNNDEQSRSIQVATEDIADRIAVNIFQKIPVRPNGNQAYKLVPVFHAFSSNLTGTILEMQVRYNTIINFNTTP